MSALGLYAALALIAVASAIVGQGVRAALGQREWSWLSPAVGLAALLVIGGLAIRLPGRATTAAVILVVALLAALAALWRRSPPAPDALPLGALVVAAIVAAATLPFAASGGFGALGPDVNWDIATHVINAEWLRSHEGAEPPQVADGYPIAPHGLAAMVSALTGAGLLESFMALLIATAMVAALAAVEVASRFPRGLRTIACLLVGLAYLAASFYVQSAFKETLMGALVLAFALGLREATGGQAGRRPLVAAGVGLGLIAAAAVATYSYAALAWVGAIIGFWAVAFFVDAGSGVRGARSRLATLAPAAVAGLVVLVLAAAADVPRMLDFADAGESQFADTATANLTERIAPYEALGVWLESDYRFGPSSDVARDLWAAIGLAALAFAAVQLWRRRELALLGGVASVVAGWVAARLAFGIYSQAKALAIAAPILMLAALYGLLLPALPLRGVWLRYLRVGLAAVFVAGALASTYLVLAAAKVHRDDTSAQLSELRSAVEGGRVLFLGSDLFAVTELYGPLYSGAFEERGSQPATRLDFDTYFPDVLDEVDFVVTGRTPYTSEPPPNFHREQVVGPFVLWERTGPTPDRSTLGELDAPGAVLDCSKPQAGEIASGPGVARVFDPPPVQGPASAWTDEAGTPVAYPQIADGRTVAQTLDLTRGRWEISLQYMSPQPLRLTGPGLDVELPARLETVGAFPPAGSVAIRSADPARFTVSVADPPLLRRVLTVGVDEPTAAVGAIAAMPADGGRSTIPLREACGEFVDWYRAR